MIKIVVWLGFFAGCVIFIKLSRVRFNKTKIDVIYHIIIVYYTVIDTEIADRSSILSSFHKAKNLGYRRNELGYDYGYGYRLWL